MMVPFVHVVICGYGAIMVFAAMIFATMIFVIMIYIIMIYVIMIYIIMIYIIMIFIIMIFVIMIHVGIVNSISQVVEGRRVMLWLGSHLRQVNFIPVSSSSFILQSI